MSDSWMTRWPSYRKRALERLDIQIAAMEERVLNARTVEAAKHFHVKYDALVARREEITPR